MHIVSLCILSILSLVSAQVFVDHSNPYLDGPLTPAYLSIPGSQLPFQLSGWLNVYYPTQPGSYSTILFMTGLDSDVPGGYSDVSGQVATHGTIIVYIQFFPPAVPSDDLYLTFTQTADFIMTNLTSFLPKGVSAYVENGISLMGHSAGGKIVVKTLIENCTFVQSAILLDPVDGDDPWHIINDYVIHPPDMLQFTVPTLFVGSGLGAVPGHSFLPACCPKGYGYERFVAAWQCSAFVLDALDYGHADLLDSVLWEGLYLTQFCKTTDLIYTLDAYKSFIAGAISSFVTGIVQRNCDQLKYIQTPSLFPIPNITFTNNFKAQGCTNSCPLPSCAALPTPPPPVSVALN